MRNHKGSSKRWLQLALSLVGMGLLWGLVATAQTLTAEIEIDPANPTSHDLISIRLFGVWPDSCVPRSPQVTILGKEIRLDTINLSGACLAALTSWELVVSIGLLPAETYQVTAIHHAFRGEQVEELELGQEMFTVEEFVGGLVTRISPSQVVCWNLTSGQIITILNPGISWNCEEAGLVVQPGNQVFTGVRGNVD